VAAGGHADRVPFTLVALHAHPDDETLLMGGTIARAAAEGHRVVLVTATDGSAGLAATSMSEGLGQRRLAELDRAAGELGVHRVVHLGYPDGAFEDVTPADAVAALVRVLEQEDADVLTGYDPSGGYGHPDHVQVHRVARAAADRLGGPVLLEATVDRALLVGGARILRVIPGAPRIGQDRMRQAYLPRAEITHRVDVGPFVAAKLRALAAHESQQSGGPGLRTVTILRRLPTPLARLVLGHEWFREVGRPAGMPSDDIFESCRR
jgi:LmbE family N-acetylglucosaminyl deacetylase